jgi:hypothetical protein
VAADAAFHCRGMIPQKRPPQIGMALEALQVWILGIYEFIRNGSMRIVAIRAFHFFFSNGVM